MLLKRLIIGLAVFLGVKGEVNTKLSNKSVYIAQIKKVTSIFERASLVKLNNSMFGLFCFVSIIALCIVLFSIIFFVGKTGFLTFNDITLHDFFFSLEWYPMEELYGAGVFIIGTLLLTAMTLAIATPLALIIAVFIAEIAPVWIKNIMRPLLDLLAGIPSIIYGYLGVTILIPLLRKIADVQMGDGIFAAALVLTLMILPIVTRLVDDCIVNFPKEYREAAYALGSTRFQVISKVIIPSIRQGIITAVILGMARAIGETMAVVMVIGNVAQLPLDFFTSTAVLTSNIVMQITAVQSGTTWHNALYMMAFLLLGISLLLIFCVRLLRSKGEYRA